MKIIILAGGTGRRLALDRDSLPKPLVPIGNQPLLWHIMKIFAYQGFNDFVICLGHKADIISDAVLNFTETKEGEWTVNLVDTGLEATKLERIKFISENLPKGLNLISYADNLCNLDMEKLLDDHKKSGKMFTVTGVRPHSPYGHIFKDDGKLKFKEKPVMLNSLVNAGFMVFEASFLDYIKSFEGDLEKDVISSLADDELLNVYEHKGNWNGINNLKDYDTVNNIYEKGNAFWEIWKK